MMELDTIVCGDCLDVMADMPDGCVDLLVADPPFGLGHWEWVEGWLEVAKRILKPNASLYVFCGIGEKSDSLSRLLPVVKELFVFKNLITWKKQRGYGTQRNWMYTREEIIFAINGLRYVFNPQYTQELRVQADGGSFQKNAERYAKSPYKRCSNVWTGIREVSALGKIPNPEWTRTNVAQKPEVLLERIILASSNKGDLVFDPFMGSGTTAVAALKLGRHFYGCDISPEYVELANKRIERARLEMAQLSFSV